MKGMIASRIMLYVTAAALGGATLMSAGCSGDSTSIIIPASQPVVASVVFTNMSAAKTDIERSTVYTRSSAVVTFADGTTRAYPLSYTTLFHSSDQISGVIPGGVIDYKGTAIMDTSVAGASNQFISDAPDANSLLKVDGATATGLGGNPLFLATQYEYVTADNSGMSRYGLLPMHMSLATLDQNRTDGSLRVAKMKQIDFSAVGGLWIPCAGSLSPWNTHLGSEEYEPDARSFEAGLNNLSGQPILTSMSLYYSDLLLTPSPYNYGISPEVTIMPDGSTSVVKHYSLGRIALELVQVMPDNRTVYMGDDGDYTGLFMYVADKEKDLSAGTLYAGKWTQTNGVGAGVATLSWIRLGHATDVSASLRNFAPVQAGPDGAAIAADVPDVAAVVAGFPGGVVATFSLAGYGRPDPVNGATLVGTGGVLRVDMAGSRLEMAPAGAAAFDEVAIPDGERWTWRVEADFVDAIRHGTPARLNDFATGVRYMRFTDAVHEADATGRRVAL